MLVTEFFEKVKATEGYEMIEVSWRTAQGMVLSADPHGTETREIWFAHGRVAHGQRDGHVFIPHGTIDFAEGLRWLCGHGG